MTWIDSVSQVTHKEYRSRIKAGLLNEHWQPLSREMESKTPSGYCGKDHLLTAMRDNLEQLDATSVLELLKEQAEQAS